MLLRLFFTAETVSLKPLTRAHRTIQHFSKNTPQHKRIISFTTSFHVHKHTKVRRAFHRILYRDGNIRILPWNPPDHVRPSEQPRKRPLRKGRRIYYSIDFVFVNALFKNFQDYFSRTPLRRTLPRRFLHRPSWALSMITPAPLKADSESSG